MCSNCKAASCSCPDGQSVTHCRANAPYYAYCDACGHNARSGSLKAEAVDAEDAVSDTVLVTA